MNSVFKGLWLAAIALAPSGCVSAGNEVLKMQDTATVNRYVIDKKTTREEIFSIYGAPNRKTIASDNKEIWTYTWAHRAPQGQNYIPIVGPFVAAVDVQEKP